MQDNVPNLTVKQLSNARWESRIENMKVIKFQVPNIRDALLELANVSEDGKTKREANCLAKYEIEDFEFLFSLNIWYDILFVVNVVSKKLQSKGMHLDIAIVQLQRLISYFEKHRENRFESALSA